MATVTIDGKQYEVPKFKFGTLKRAWPLIKAAREDGDPLEMVSACIKIVSMGLERTHPEMTPEFIEENLDGLEVEALSNALSDILKESGLIKNDGDALGEAVGGAPLTATSTELSPNLSQPVVPEAIGTL